ncbi:MAG: DUF3375 domain-containing protein [Spirochaetia bacterium]|nr:DUF3375 domain-containing protein [Spirochaetia bacterium]
MNHIKLSIFIINFSCNVGNLVIRYNMPFDFYDLINKKKIESSWRLMNADNGPLIISFFDKVFREDGLRQIDEYNLVLRLDDYLYQLMDGREDDPFPRTASDYLEEWTKPERGWLRKFYPSGSDIPHYELTAGSEKVLQWIDSLASRRFIGTESRLQTCFDLLKQIVQGVETDSEVRIKELQEQRAQIGREIERIASGDISIMDQRQIIERFMQFKQIAQELRSDFTAVEGNFRELDREIREEIATFSGKKGELLEQFFGNHDKITSSDEGKSFRAFWDFIMSPDSQEELSRQLDRVFELEEIGELREDATLRRIHFDWIAAGETTQRTVARLSRQLRRFLDDRVILENRRITELLDDIERKAFKVREDNLTGDWMETEGLRVHLSLPMEQPLYSPPPVQELISMIEFEEEQEIDTSGLFNLINVDKERLYKNIEQALKEKGQIRLDQLLEEKPLEQGLAELITYLHIAEMEPFASVSEEIKDYTFWNGKGDIIRKALVPRVIFTQRSTHGIP